MTLINIEDIHTFPAFRRAITSPSLLLSPRIFQLSGTVIMPKVAKPARHQPPPPELKSAHCAQSTPNLDVRLTRTQSGNILDIDFEFGAHGAACCWCLCPVLP